MLKISIVDGPRQRRMIVEGALIAPWIDELVTACEKIRADLHGRELVVDVRGLTTISTEGVNVLFRLMKGKIKLRRGVYVRELLSQLAHDKQRHLQEVGYSLNDADSEREDDRDWG
jgi:hypothetical protein